MTRGVTKPVPFPLCGLLSPFFDGSQRLCYVPPAFLPSAHRRACNFLACLPWLATICVFRVSQVRLLLETCLFVCLCVRPFLSMLRPLHVSFHFVLLASFVSFMAVSSSPNYHLLHSSSRRHFSSLRGCLLIAAAHLSSPNIVPTQFS